MHDQASQQLVTYKRSPAKLFDPRLPACSFCHGCVINANSYSGHVPAMPALLARQRLELHWRCASMVPASGTPPVEVHPTDLTVVAAGLMAARDQPVQQQLDRRCLRCRASWSPCHAPGSGPHRPAERWHQRPPR